MGVQKGAISEGVRGGLSSLFAEDSATKSDEQAISYFTVNRSFSAKLLFSSMIWSAECFFHGLYDSLGNTTVVVPPPWLPLIIN